MILPLLRGLQSDVATATNDSLDTGAGRPVLVLSQLGAAAGYNPIHGAIVTSNPLGALPKYDGSDVFPVDTELE